jgi:hypothetical protein
MQGIGDVLRPEESGVTRAQLDNLDPDGFVEWAEAFPVLREQTNKNRKAAERRPGAAEHTFAFYLPDRKLVP